MISAFCLRTTPVSLKPRWNSLRTFAESRAPLLLRNPITGKAGCCARAASGQVTAAPPTRLMNSRRLMGFVLKAEDRNLTTLLRENCASHRSENTLPASELDQTRSFGDV